MLNNEGCTVPSFKTFCKEYRFFSNFSCLEILTFEISRKGRSFWTYPHTDLGQKIRNRKQRFHVLVALDAFFYFSHNIAIYFKCLSSCGCRPAYGLNVLSMTKHQTLVLTEAAVEHITRRLLFALNRSEKD
jgi:hypothetical protein